MDNGLSKKERIYGRTDISRLLSKGRYLTSGCLRCCYLDDNGLPYSRIMVSVPKRFFKRAVKRNLLKRRIRESYRVRKSVFADAGIHTDIMFTYTSKDIFPSAELAPMVESAMHEIVVKYNAHHNKA